MASTPNPFTLAAEPLRDTIARASARDSVIDALILLILAQLDALFAKLEAMFAAWQDGTLPPLPAPVHRPAAPPRAPVASSTPAARAPRASRAGQAFARYAAILAPPARPTCRHAGPHLHHAIQPRASQGAHPRPEHPTAPPPRVFSARPAPRPAMP